MDEFRKLLEARCVRLLHLLSLPINLRVEDGHELLNELLWQTLHFLVAFVVSSQFGFKVVDFDSQLLPVLSCFLVTISFNLEAHCLALICVVIVTLPLEVQFVMMETLNPVIELLSLLLRLSSFLLLLPSFSLQSLLPFPLLAFLHFSIYTVS